MLHEDCWYINTLWANCRNSDLVRQCLRYDREKQLKLKREKLKQQLNVLGRKHCKDKDLILDRPI